MTDECLHKYLHRYPHVRVRKGGGQGCPALLSYEMLRTDIKQRIFEKYGDIRQHAKRNRLQELIQVDYKASKFFAEYQFDDQANIKAERQVEYNANATILNAVGNYVADATGKNKRLSGKTTGIWNAVSDAVNTLDNTRYPHTLPTNPLRLKEKFRSYQEHGYLRLIHKGTGNKNAKRMNDQIERLIMSIYCMDNLPFSSCVYDNYLKFLSGYLTIVDKETGNIYDREEFFDGNKGCYITISRGTVWNIIHDPQNAIIIDRMRNNRIDHITHNTPFNHRKPPQYSLSKISMDDRTFSRKTADGKWLNAYVAFDVLSQVELGCVYSIEKPTLHMIWECFREMYHTINTNSLMWPGEVEVENHLMKGIEEELRQMFAYVTFCAPGLSRSKRAEHLIHGKKYGDEKSNQVGIGRYNQKGPYKTKSPNKDEDYKQPRIPIERLIAEDKESVYRYNHVELHPNQKMFPGKTRWQVLVENMNPDLSRPQKHKLFRYIGIKTETSIRNNDFVQVQYEKYAIDQLTSISRLKPNNYNVESFYVPDQDGNISEVFIYQDDTFITKATKIERYNEAKMERTERDEQIRTHQAKRQEVFFKAEKDGIQEKITRKIEIFAPVDYSEMEAEIIPSPPVEKELSNEEYLAKVQQNYSPQWAQHKAIEDV